MIDGLQSQQFFPGPQCANLPSSPQQPVLQSVPVSNPLLEQLFRRLDQQDVEIRKLRTQLGQTQSEVREAPTIIPARGVSPAAYLSQGDTPNGYAAGNVLYEIDQRLNTLDQRISQQALLSTSKDDSSAGAATPVKGYEVGTDKAMTATWNNGVELKSKNGDFRLRIGGFAQYDFSWLDPEAHLTVPPAVGGIGPDPDSTQIRRARLTMDGTMYEVFDFRFEFDLANDITPAVPSAGQPVASSPALTDLWVQWTHIPVIGAIRVGNQKEALGLEHLEAPTDLSFLEPSYLFDLLFGPFNTGFNPGVAILNSTTDKRMTWELGVWGNNSDPFGYSIGNDWALSGRSTYLLYYDEPTQGRYLWEIGASGSVRTPDEGLVRLRDRGDIRSGPPGVLNPIYADTGALQSDQQDIACVETFAQWGRWSLQAEYAGTWVENAVQPLAPPAARTARGTPFFQGGYVEVWYFLTDDNRTFNLVYGVPARTVPLENAFWVRNACGNCCGGWGAWQVGVRYNTVDLNDNGINGGMLNSFTFGVNWFLNANAKMQFNYDFTDRSQVKTVAAGDINGFGVRFQYVF